MTNNVFDLKTGHALFSERIKQGIQEGITPYFRDGLPDGDRKHAVNVVEQVICTALVAAAVALATKLANKIAGKIISQP